MKRIVFILFPWFLLLVLIPELALSLEREDLSSSLHSFRTHPTRTADGEWLHEPKRVADIYKVRNDRPIWTEEDGRLNQQGQSLLQAIRESDKDGLLPEFYHLSRIENLLASEAQKKNGSGGLGLELSLTDAFLALGNHLFSGQVEASRIDANWAIPHRTFNAEKQLEPALENGVATTLNLLAPRDVRYQQLKVGLATYRDWEKKGPFPALENGPRLRAGSDGKRVQELRKRLSREGYLKENSNAPSLFDSDVEKAVMAFQGSHGLVPDGVVGLQTLSELNVPLQTRIRQIALNMERLRWFPRALGDRYLFVDIAAFSVTAFDSGKPVLTMRTVVGDDHRETPIFDAKVALVVINPAWLIPQSIVEQEILPKLRSHPSLLRSKKFRVLANRGGKLEEVEPSSIDWSQVDPEHFPYVLEEPSSPQNPLGPLKFIFPNRFSVYLHGTPDTGAFQREQRTLSHGCIRVEDPVSLAVFLLKGSSPSWTEEGIRQAIASTHTLTLSLPTPVPVYLWYRTAWVGEDDTIQFRRDIYGWDEELWNALMGKPLFSQRDAVLPY